MPFMLCDIHDAADQRIQNARVGRRLARKTDVCHFDQYPQFFAGIQLNLWNKQ